jgi:hypothetical protein
MICPHCGKPIREANPTSDLAQTLLTNTEFLVDMARFADSLLSEADVRRKYYLSDEDWERAGNDDALIRAIEAEKIRRTRNGSTARERAQQAFTAAPTILNAIMTDANISPRHKIEAAREIRATAAVGLEAQPASEMFQITINLGGDEVLRFNKPKTVGVADDGKTIDGSKLITDKREGDDGNAV